MLANVVADNIAMLGLAVGKDVLDKVVSELVASNYEHVSTEH